MEVSWQTALEVFGLKDGFTNQELSKEFRRLSKLVHPDVRGDANLFRFIKCCQEKLSNGEETQETQKTQEPEKRNQSQSQSKEYRVDLQTLYDIYYDLNDYTRKYNITSIYGAARIYITPRFRKYECKTTTIALYTSFANFSELGFVDFVTTITIPETFKKFKRFNVRVEFMGKTFKFKLSMKKPFHIIKYDPTRFHSIVELHFE